MFYQYHHIENPEYMKRENGENFSYPLHMHQCFELVTVVDGEMEISVDNKKIIVTKNEAVLIFPNRLHSLNSTKSKHLLFIFSPKIVQTFAFKHKGTVPVLPKTKLSQEAMNSLLKLNSSDSLTRIKGVLYSIVADFEDQIEFTPAENDNDNLLVRIFGFVERNAKQECSLIDVSHELGYDHAYISRFFKKATGMSYNSYVNVCRLNNAGYLLKNTDMSILECAIESGYKSLRSFNRNFKEYYNTTPNDYKKSTKSH